MLYRTERISPVAETESTNTTLAVDTMTAISWSDSNSLYDSTKLYNGWHAFALKEGSDSYEASILIINASNVVIHEGVLSKNETWATGKIHVVRHWVRVPENVTLTIAPNAIVKFCEDTGILVDGTLNADGAVFTVITDDTVGGDTAFKSAFNLGYKTYQIAGDGVISLNGTDNRYETNAGKTENSAMSQTAVRLDVRTSIGGQMLHGTETVASLDVYRPVIEIDLRPFTGWNTTTSLFDSSQVQDGWHNLFLYQTYPLGNNNKFLVTAKSVFVINTPNVVIHEGILAQSETWSANKLHIVRHWVRVPENITLTIAPNAIVKFCEDTGILVEGTLNAEGAVFTVIADDSVGGDTDMLSTFKLGYRTYEIAGDGTISMDGTDNRYEMNAGGTENTCMSAVGVRLDLRSSVGGRLLVGEEYISPVAEEENANARMTVDGAEFAGWNVDSPWIDSSKLTNDWHVFALNEGYETLETELLPMNRNDVVVHEGILENDETWTADKLHIVRHWVRVPTGVTLTIQTQSIVKFCEETGILLEEGGTLKGNHVVFTSIMDDSDGDDTDMNGRSAAMGYGFYDIMGEGTIELTDCDNRGLASLVEDTVWKAGDVIHVMGQLKVPTGVSLTIQPGVVVKFASGAELKADGGSISANGAMFTHIADDSEEAGGDTNGDGDATSPVHDAYKLTGFTPSVDCELRYITMTFTGGTISDTKYLRGNCVHQLTGNITIASGGKLIIQPGAIIKMNAGGLITVNSGGTLEALGNRFQPIVFTSIKDDEHGGDTNGDGFSVGAAGDWRVVYIHGQTNMSYCQLFYGGNTSNGEYNDKDCGIVSISDSGSASLDNCLISDSIFEGIKSYGHDVVVTNTIIQYCNRGVNTRGKYLQKYINCITYGCEVGFMEDGPETFVVNSIASECTQRGFWPYYNKMTIQNCLSYSTIDGYIHGLSNGSDGNIIADPLFTDAENGDFSLKTGSPCIDAGDGTVAPEFDYWGSPRMNVAKIADNGVPNTDGVCPDIGIYEMPGVGGGATSDLSVSNIVFDVKAYHQDDLMTVTWQDVNSGEAAAIGPWRDVVSFVRKKEQVTYVVEAASVTVPATLKSGRSQSMSASFKLPALLPGEWQIQVAANQYRDIFEGEGGESNILLTEETFTVEMDGIPVGNSSLQVASDSQKTLMLTGGAANGAVLRLMATKGADLSVTASAGRIPTEDDFHWCGVKVIDGQWIVEIPKGTEGDVFVTIANNGDSSANVSAQRSAASATIFGTDVSKVANGGMASVVIYGAGLDKTAAAELGTVSATNIHVLSSMELVASFDLTNMAIGDYQLTVTLEGGRVLTMDGAIIVSQGAIGPRLMAGFSMPETLRPGRWYSGTITYRNDGDRDAIAPLLYLTGHDVTFLDTDDGFTEHAGHIVLAGLASDGDPSVIRPGRTYTVNVKFRGTNANASSVGIHFTFLDPNEDELKWNMLLGGDDEMFAKRKADLETDFGTPLGLLKAAFEVCGHCSQYGRPMLDVLSVMEKLAAKPDDVEYGYVSGVMVSRDDGQALANCSLVVDGGENDVCYVKTDAGGRFCAWGVPVGRNVTFGGPEGFYYFADDTVTLDNVQKSGVTVYRLAEDNSTPQKTHTVADYKLVKDADGVVWMVWLADDVLYAALADDPEHTTVSLPSDVKWYDFYVENLGNDEITVFLKSANTCDLGNGKRGDELYNCSLKRNIDKIEFLSLKKYKESRKYTDLSIISVSDELSLGIWKEFNNENVSCLMMQYYNKGLLYWDDEPFSFNESTRGGFSISGTHKLGKYCELTIKETPISSHKYHCDTDYSASLEGEVKIDLLALVITASLEGSLGNKTQCQYYWNKNADGECNPEYDESEYSASVDVKTYVGMTKPRVDKISLENKLANDYVFDIKCDFDFGPVIGGGYTYKKHHYSNNTQNTEHEWKFTWGGKGHAAIGCVIEVYFPKYLGGRLKRKIPLTIEGEGSIIGYYKWSSKNGFGAESTITLSGSAGPFSLTLEKKCTDEGWQPWEISNVDVSIWDDTGETRGASEVTLDSNFPIDGIKDINTIDETCNVQLDIITQSSQCIFKDNYINGVASNPINSYSLIKQTDGKTGCFITRGEISHGYSESRLLYFEISNNGRVGEVKRLHNVHNDYVHGTIIPCSFPNGDLSVVYMVSKLDYSGTIADYFESMNTYQVYCVERRNGQWEEPYLVVDYDVKEVVACYDEMKSRIQIAWLVETEDGTQTIYAGAVRNKALEDVQVLSRNSSSMYGKLTMLMDKESKIRTSWIDLGNSSVNVQMAVFADEVWQLTSYVLPLNDHDELEEETTPTRGIGNSTDSTDMVVNTRGTEIVTYEACGHCKKEGAQNCGCGCAKAGTEYIPTVCRCNQRISSNLIPADCAHDNFCCADCNCKQTGYNQRSVDPNEIVGVAGMGDPSTQRFVRPGDWLEYTIYFENKSTADVPAQEISIDMALNPAVVDMRSLTFGDVVFGSQTVDALNGWKSNGTFSVTQKGTRYLVNGEATRNLTNGAIHWYMRSYDASAEENGFFPEDIYAGFLPPNDSTHRGEGHVTFRVRVKDNAPDGAFINAEATIVFDANDPITTSPAWFNWVTTEEEPVADNTTLRWDTSDDANGTTYVVSYWSGDPYPTAPGTTITFNSETLTTGSWALPDLYPDTYYWYVTKTVDGESSRTSTWSFDILASHTLTVNGGTGGGRYRTNSRVTVEANIVEGKTFMGWTATGIELSEAELLERRLVFYMPDSDVTLTAKYGNGTESEILLLPGWNLIAAPGELSEAENAALFEELKPFVLNRESMAYVHASLPLLAGEPMWIYNRTRQNVSFVYENIDGIIGGLTDEAGWHLIGVGGSEDAMIDHVLSAWQWENGRWSPLDIHDGFVSLSAGRGYFVYKEEGDVNCIPFNWIRQYFNGSDFHVSADADGDGLTNREEYKYGTNPVKSDTDGDGMPDGWEVRYGLDPVDASDATKDWDGDGLSNLSEYEKGLDPSTANGSNDKPLYMIIDLSGGPDAEKYPIRFSNSSPKLNDDKCRTTELWLRRIPKGTFVMGWTEEEFGDDFNETMQHEETLTEDYYIGVFECTQKQWELVMGSNPSKYKGDKRPVDTVYHTASFMDQLELKTGLTFGLPSEAEWEYACRAGTTTSLNSGKNLTIMTKQDIAMDKVGRYKYNKNDGRGGYVEHTTVGCYQPNRWGLYDMHGNVREWCYWEKNLSFGILPSVGGTTDIMRGGSWNTDAWECSSANHRGHSSSVLYDSEYWSENGFRIVCHPQEDLYVVVDLSGGPDATNYPVRYSAVGPDLNDDTCRTTELWLRKIPKGTFIMGSPEDEVGRFYNERQHEVTLTQDYYMGVFECTQKQWELVMGDNPSYFNGDCRPVECVSYDMIRGTSTTAGAGWPAYGHIVDATSFMGKLQAKTGLTFDLPTEAQWEYACRAGTTTAFNSGKNLTPTTVDSNMAEVGRYLYNRSDNKGGYSQHTMVGSYLPNAWGLYDMHGNVFEWCLDWFESNYGTDAVEDPLGPRPNTGYTRVIRGGFWYDHARICRSANRSDYNPSTSYYGYVGFRIAFLP